MSIVPFIVAHVTSRSFSPSPLPVGVALGRCPGACSVSPLELALFALPMSWQAVFVVLAVLFTVAHVTSVFVRPSLLPIGVAGSLCRRACNASPLVLTLPVLLACWHVGKLAAGSSLSLSLFLMSLAGTSIPPRSLFVSLEPCVGKPAARPLLSRLFW